jgi:DNA polymerase-3 subunit epsilon
MTAAPWWLGPLTPFDIETTGINVREDRIVTGFVGTVGPRRPGGRMLDVRANVLINPGVPIPPEASAVNGLTDEVVRAKGADPYDAINGLAEELARSLVAHIPVIGHNISFDLSMLYWECLRWGLPTVAERMGLPPAANVGPIIDTLVLDKHTEQYRRGSRKLADHPEKGPGVATHYGIPLAAAHEAEADAMAAAGVAVRIAEKYPDEIMGDPRQLHQVQKLWAFDQRGSLQTWLRKKNNDPTLTIDRCWPMCTSPDHPAG